MSGVFELNKQQTQRALTTRRIYRVLCCERTMSQKEVYSLLPTDKVPFGRSLIVLQCPTCKKVIELELFTSYPALAKILKVLDKAE